jgi:hypothetical protein
MPQDVQAGESVCLIPYQGAALGLLRKYLQCKFQKPTETSSLVVLPDICTPLLATMFCNMYHQAKLKNIGSTEMIEVLN